MRTRCSIAGWIIALCGLTACEHAEEDVADTQTQIPPETAVVTVAQGALRGVVVEDGVHAFLGVPYAAPPLGELRWRASAPAATWNGVRDASTFPASCLQALAPDGRGPWTHEYVVQDHISEDCLYLNLWVPAQPAAAPRAVLFWIHGGGFIEGSASLPIYNGAALARHGIIVASVNYRLGAQGYLAHPWLSAEGGGHSGNYGLLDMIAALRWIGENIAEFGGDPAQVTIAGQSAGAMAVHQLMVSPEARGLFARAIAQSGSGMMSLPPLAAGERAGIAFADKAGAASLAELRALPAGMLLKLDEIDPTGVGRFSPVVDGRFIPYDPDGLLPEGTYTDTPLLTGLTVDEYSGFDDYDAVTPANFAARLQATLGAQTEAACRFYPAETTAQASASAKALALDRGLAAAWRWARQRMQNGGREPVWLYLYAHPEPGPDADKYGAFHSSEIPYVFQTLDAAPERPFTETDRKILQTVARYWVNFVKTGDPNSDGLPRWPQLNLHTPQLLYLDQFPVAQPVLSDEKRALFMHHVDAGGRVDLF